MTGTGNVGRRAVAYIEHLVADEPRPLQCDVEDPGVRFFNLDVAGGDDPIEPPVEIVMGNQLPDP